MPSQIILLPDGRVNIWSISRQDWAFETPLTEAEFIADRREHALKHALDLRTNPEEAANVTELQHRMWLRALREHGPSGVYYGMAVHLNEALRRTIWRPGGWHEWEREAMLALDKAPTK